VHPRAIRLTRIRLPPYSDGMISEFQELSNKIDQLAEMTHGLRRENAWLRQSNTALVADNIEYHRRLFEAHARVEALLQKIPPLVAEAPVAPATEPHAAPMPVDGGMQ
jgi:cell division protein ZapB